MRDNKHIVPRIDLHAHPLSINQYLIREIFFGLLNRILATGKMVQHSDTLLGQHSFEPIQQLGYYTMQSIAASESRLNGSGIISCFLALIFSNQLKHERRPGSVDRNAVHAFKFCPARDLFFTGLGFGLRIRIREGILGLGYAIGTRYFSIFFFCNTKLYLSNGDCINDLRQHFQRNLAASDYIGAIFALAFVSCGSSRACG